MGDSNYHLDQIIEAINRSSRRMEILLRGKKTTTSTGNSNSNDDYGANKIHDYHDEGEGVDISDEYETEEIISIIDRINWEILSEMTKKRNMAFGYHGEHPQILPTFYNLQG